MGAADRDSYLENLDAAALRSLVRDLRAENEYLEAKVAQLNAERAHIKCRK